MNETLTASELGNRRAPARGGLWPLPYAVAAEWLLALWLISGVRPRPARP